MNTRTSWEFFRIELAVLSTWAIELFHVKNPANSIRRANSLLTTSASIVMFVCVLLASCAGASSSNTPQKTPAEIQETPEIEENTVFKAPTAETTTTTLIDALVSPIASATSTIGITPHPSTTPICIDNLRYVEDLTVPDGTRIGTGQPIDKRWLVENSGSCNWGVDYSLRLIQGPCLGAATEQALYPALSDTRATIRIIFTSPAEPGAYRSAWQAHSPNGQPFGDIIYIDILVNS